jgi:uncharacterized zinc-type alcohol dehydrogenase-like protein
MVPGHEIAGVVTNVGAKVSRYKVGDQVGVGCFVDSCRVCGSCKAGEDHLCDEGMTQTYNGRERADQSPTFGGYSEQIVVNEDYVLRIPDNLPLDKAGPLLCAGITTYSPLKHWGVKPGSRVGVIGLGGLGHMAVKLAAAMQAEVTVFSHSDRKEADAKRMGAKYFVNTSDAKVLENHALQYDLIINTVSANIDLNAYLMLLKRDATLVVVGAPEKPSLIGAFPLIVRRRSLAGSLIGSIKETQEMLNFCSQHNITPEIELIKIDQINTAYDRMVKGDVHYRFVIDMESLKA